MRPPVKVAVVLLSIGLAVALYRAYILVSPGPGAVAESSSRSSVAKDSVSPANPSRSNGSKSKSVEIIQPDDGKWSLRKQAPAEATIKETVVEDLPIDNKHAVHLVVTAIDPAKFWAAQLVKDVPQDVRANRNMVVHFWGRSKQSTPIWLIFEEGKPPHTPELQQKVTLSPEWKQYELPFRTTRDHINPHGSFCIKAGIQAGEIEVAGIYVDEI